MITVHPSESFEIPGIPCPECGGRLYGEVDEWETETGLPTEGGLAVSCENEEDAEAEEPIPHRRTGDLWIPVEARCERWAAREVRVRDDEMVGSAWRDEKRERGADKIRISDDFNDPLSEEELELYGL